MADRVEEACEACFDAHAHDCSGFVKAVASQLGVELDGLANEIVDTIRSGNGWTPLRNGVAAADSAAGGKLVIGGLKGSEQANPRSARACCRGGRRPAGPRCLSQRVLGKARR